MQAVSTGLAEVGTGQACVVLGEVVRVEVFEIESRSVIEFGVEHLSGALAILDIEVDAAFQGEANVGDGNVAAVTRTIQEQ